MIPEEIKDCRKYIKLMFPKFFGGFGDSRPVRAACANIGCVRGVVREAMFLLQSERECGHPDGECKCEDGLIAGQMYEISRKDKSPVMAHYVRWTRQKGNYSDPGKHEVRTEFSWISVKSEDVKDRVKGEFRNVPSVEMVARPTFRTRSEIRDGKLLATCNLCGEMVQVVQHFRYKRHVDPATKQQCWRSMKSVGGKLDDGSYIA
jgi:hypothetical protein